MGADGPVTSRRKPTVTIVRSAAVADSAPGGASAKPTLVELGVDLKSLDWQRSGADAGSIEVAFVAVGRSGDSEDQHRGAVGARGADWVLLRVARDPAGRVLVFSRTEWMCFLEGVGNGEFDPRPSNLRRRG
jgi:hypothetical protein